MSDLPRTVYGRLCTPRSHLATEKIMSKIMPPLPRPQKKTLLHVPFRIPKQALGQNKNSTRTLTCAPRKKRAFAGIKITQQPELDVHCHKTRHRNPGQHTKANTKNKNYEKSGKISYTVGPGWSGRTKKKLFHQRCQ